MAEAINEPNFYMEMNSYNEITMKNFSTYDVGHCDILHLNCRDVFNRPMLDLKVYPNGNCDANEGFISVDLLLIRPIPKPYVLEIKCVISLLDTEGNHRFSQSLTNESGKTYLSIEKFASRQKIKDDVELLRDGDRVVLCCDVTYSIREEGSHLPIAQSLPQELKTPKKKIKIKILSGDKNKELIEIVTKDGKTFELMVNENEVLDHPLCRYSRVFARMMDTEMSEKRTRRIAIDDIDYDTMDRVVSFAEGKMIAMTDVQQIADLYTAAHKYEILGLKRACAKDLLANASPGNISKVFSLASLYDDKHLKCFAGHYVQTNLADIEETDDWKQFEEDHPVLASEAKTYDLTEFYDFVERFARQELGVEASEDAAHERDDQVSQIYS